MLANSHHVIPENVVNGPPIGLPSGNSTVTYSSNYTYVPPTETTHASQYFIGNIIGSLIVLLVVTVLILGFAYIVFRLQESGNLPSRESSGSDLIHMEKYLYQYRGLRKRLREIYLLLRQQAESVMGRSLKSLTFREILAQLNIYTGKLVSVYNNAMYSADQPIEEQVKYIEEEVGRIRQKWVEKQ